MASNSDLPKHSVPGFSDSGMAGRHSPFFAVAWQPAHRPCRVSRGNRPAKSKNASQSEAFFLMSVVGDRGFEPRTSTV